MKQSHIFVPDMCEINVEQKKFPEPLVDLHKLRKSKSVRLCPALPYFCAPLFQSFIFYIKYIQIKSKVCNFCGTSATIRNCKNR